MNINKIDQATERCLTLADRIRAGKKSAPQHYEAADIAITYSLTGRTFEASLHSAYGLSTVSVERALEALAQDLEMRARSLR